MGDEQLNGWLNTGWSIWPVGYRSGISWVNCEWEHLMWVTGQWWAHVRFLCVWVCGCVCAHGHTWHHFAYVLLWISDHRTFVELDAFLFNSTVCSWKMLQEQLTVSDILHLFLLCVTHIHTNTRLNDGMIYYIMHGWCPAVVGDCLPLVAKS